MIRHPAPNAGEFDRFSLAGKRDLNGFADCHQPIIPLCVRRAGDSTTLDGVTLMVRVDKAGTHVWTLVNAPPKTVLRAEPLVILGLATGMLTVQQAIATGNLSGDQHDLAAVFTPR
jgi:hypothetical protein